MSERRACQVSGQALATQRRPLRHEAALVVEILDLASRFGRYGYRAITGLPHLALQAATAGYLAVAAGLAWTVVPVSGARHMTQAVVFTFH